MTAPTTGEQERPLPDRVTMPLLELVTRDAVDEDYLHAAQRRAASGSAEPPQRTSLRGAAVVTLVFGLLIALAAVQTARNADVREASRDALVDRIGERETEVAALEDRIDRLREQNDSLEASSVRLRGDVAVVTVELRNLQISTGFVPVTGPGVRFTVADNPDGSPDGRVRATDLRRLVNGLWRAGAEAIAINGRRLTALSAIAQVDISIQVNRGPLSPPYVVSAIGDAGLASRFETTASGAQFLTLADQFGFEVDRQNEGELLLPSAPDNQLRLGYVQRPGDNRDDEEDLP